MTTLTAWSNFYVIVGSSAGALIGLQFVVMSLIANMPTVRANAQAGYTFSTPTVIHFGAALLLSAILNAPWRMIGAAAVLWGIVGLAGIVYAAITTRRMRVQTAYRPEFEDWLFHVLLPFAAYIALGISACVAPFYVRHALFAVGAAALLLLFTGIHNAWDAVTYHVFVKKPQETGDERAGD